MADRQKMVSSMGMRTFFDLLVDHGVSAREIERKTGIIRNKPDNPRYPVPVRRLTLLVERCFEVTGNPALCLNISGCIERFGLNDTTILLMICASLLEA